MHEAQPIVVIVAQNTHFTCCLNISPTIGVFVAQRSKFVFKLLNYKSEDWDLEDSDNIRCHCLEWFFEL